ncbi:hypothetical protein ACJJTC_016155 [Scirpophaga incertulas]
MAKKQSKVYLGFEDEIIHEKNQTITNYTVNKIGGMPDWPPIDQLQFSSKCPLCGLYRPLIVQCYAPLEKSVYHRTLYIFACIAPNCWLQSESWTCIRSQIQENSITQAATVAMPQLDSNMGWCDGADEWGENDNEDTANGNFMNDDNARNPNNCIDRNSDDEDESNSFDLETMEQALGNLQAFDAHNANMSPVQGAFGAITAPVAAAELEGGDEPGLVVVDSPTTSSKDLQALFHQTAELPPDVRSRLVCQSPQFVPKYIYVEEECRASISNKSKVMELLNKYQKENAMDIMGAGDVGGDGGGAGGSVGGWEEEQYEHAIPLHGDRLFNAFITRLRENPLQILRYSRDYPPLLGAPLPNAASSPEAGAAASCCRCGAQLICELQLMPGFGNTLRLLPTNSLLSHLHFLSVLIFTCSQSCWQQTDKLVKETVVFQPEVD